LKEKVVPSKEVMSDSEVRARLLEMKNVNKRLRDCLEFLESEKNDLFQPIELL
jgi:hypothetical protein